MRDRLIELIKKGIDKHESTIENYIHPIWKFVADYLLENGVIVPPCKVGDKAYIIEKDNKIMRTNVIGVKVGHLGLYIMLEKGEEWFYIRECEIGKTLFFAEKQAFAKLKEGAE